LAVVTERADGCTLLDHLHLRGSWFPSAETRQQLEDTLATIGRWLRVFQSLDRAAGRVSIDALRAYVDVRLQRLVNHAAGFTESDRARVLEHLIWLGRQASPGDLEEAPVHADVAFGNILISGPRVVLLDFAMATRGSVLHDVSRLHMQLDLLLAKPRFRPHVIRGLQRALLRGLDPSLSSDRPFFRFLQILHRINHLTTLTIGSHPFPESAFNALVRRLHRRWLARELELR
jgi:aminoglycoside phosphotransferase (APT) family kinase protein